MSHINVEIKARCKDQGNVRNLLKENGASFQGVDHQIDTYFKVKIGRLKLREGNIENFLIYYDREDKEGPKESNVILFKTEKNSTLKDILIKSNDILVVVDKTREIYFIDNIKFHIDNVQNLGEFIEIEAIDKDGSIGKDKLYNQCQKYLKLFNVTDYDLISVSYSDLLLDKE